MRKNRLKVKTTEGNSVFIKKVNGVRYLEAEYDNGMGSVEVGVDGLTDELRDDLIYDYAKALRDALS